MLHRAEGIIIRSIDYGESNKIIVLFTENGKISVIARGAKKIKSRYAAVTQLFTYGEYTFYRSGSSMGNLNYAEILSSYHSIRTDIVKTAYVAYLAELIDRMLGEQDASSTLFKQFKAALDGIEADKDVHMITHIFEMKMLQLAGYAPVLTECVSCGIKENITRLSSALGGMLCGKCTYQDRESLNISAKTMQLLMLFSKLDLERLGTTNVSDDTRTQLKKVLRNYMDTHVPIRWKARHFLDQLEKNSL